MSVPIYDHTIKPTHHHTQHSCGTDPQFLVEYAHTDEELDRMWQSVVEYYTPRVEIERRTND